MKKPAGLQVALQAEHGRSVTRIEVFDTLGVEVTTPLPLEVGDVLKAQLRDGGPGGRLFSVGVEVRQVIRGTLSEAPRVRLDFKKPDSRAVRLLADVAARRGLFADQEENESVRTRPHAQREPGARAMRTEKVPAILLRFRDSAQRRKAIREMLNGAVFVRSSLGTSFGETVLVRIEGEDGRVVCLQGTVQFTSDGERGPQGFGLSFADLPRVIQAALRRMR